MKKSIYILLSILFISSQAAADFVLVPYTTKVEITQALLKPYSTGKITATYDTELNKLTAITYSVNRKLFVVPESFLKKIKEPIMSSIYFSQNGYDQEKIYLNVGSCDYEEGKESEKANCHNIILEVTEKAQSVLNKIP